MRFRVGSQLSGGETLRIQSELALFSFSVCPLLSQHQHSCSQGELLLEREGLAEVLSVVSTHSLTVRDPDYF